MINRVFIYANVFINNHIVKFVLVQIECGEVCCENEFQNRKKVMNLRDIKKGHKEL